ncbi:MAG: putative bifunctional diguanylate cyclase/phosphodiesterase, partial [Burkholderiales bacterium]
DEYTVVVSALREPAEAAIVASKIVRIFETPFTLENHDVSVSSSIGISVFPDDGRTLEDLVRNADAAMYYAKRTGRNRFEFFRPELTVPAAERLLLANQLRQGIGLGQLTLHYQPQLEVGSNRLIGAEALVRWTHPERGLLVPEHFIPIAEESDLIHLVGEWVLDQACRQAADWKARGLQSVPIAINFSAFQFRRTGVVQTIANTLARHALEARCIEVEMTENAIMQDSRETARILEMLHEMGVVISIDGFGTGYSSLNYLKRFAIDKLKIDDSFVTDLPTDLNDCAIVQAIISLAKSLQLKVVAAGVETRPQLEFLRGVGCDAYQGYLGGRPMDVGEFERLLR